MSEESPEIKASSSSDEILQRMKNIPVSIKGKLTQPIDERAKSLIVSECVFTLQNVIGTFERVGQYIDVSQDLDQATEMIEKKVGGYQVIIIDQEDQKMRESANAQKIKDTMSKQQSTRFYALISKGGTTNLQFDGTLTKPVRNEQIQQLLSEVSQ